MISYTGYLYSHPPIRQKSPYIYYIDISVLDDAYMLEITVSPCI